MLPPLRLALGAPIATLFAILWLGWIATLRPPAVSPLAVPSGFPRTATPSEPVSLQAPIEETVRRSIALYRSLNLPSPVPATIAPPQSRAAAVPAGDASDRIAGGVADFGPSMIHGTLPAGALKGVAASETTAFIPVPLEAAAAKIGVQAALPVEIVLAQAAMPVETRPLAPLPDRTALAEPKLGSATRGGAPAALPHQPKADAHERLKAEPAATPSVAGIPQPDAVPLQMDAAPSPAALDAIAAIPAEPAPPSPPALPLDGQTQAASRMPMMEGPNGDPTVDQPTGTIPAPAGPVPMPRAAPTRGHVASPPSIRHRQKRISPRASKRRIVNRRTTRVPAQRARRARPPAPRNQPESRDLFGNIMR